MTFVHLHVHSNYSLQDGACRLEELVQAAARAEMPALALTDHNALYGAVRFYDLCREAGIKPIIGMELSMAGGHSLLLLARTQEGYRNLCRLSSLVQCAEERPAAQSAGVSWDELARHSEGLMALTAGRRGMVEKLLRADEPVEALRAAGHLRDIFGREHTFIELQIHSEQDIGVAIRMALLARRAGLDCVATNNVHYIAEDAVARYRALNAMRLLETIDSPRVEAFLTRRAHFMLPDEAGRLFAQFPSALGRTLDIAESCQVDFPKGSRLMPRVPLPAGMEAGARLHQLAWAGLRHRLGEVTPDVEGRLEHELRIIEETGFEHYFLAVADIAQYARAVAIPFNARGSCSSSLVVYALGISDVNPLEHDLYFERFLNPARGEPPDIDVDFDSNLRRQVIDYVYGRFGEDRVAMVCTYSTYRARSALREVAKAYGVAEERADELASVLPRYYYRGGEELEEARQELDSLVQNPLEREVLRISRELEGYPRHLSVHAGGVVIAPDALTNWVGLQRAPNGVIITQADGADIERLGLVKMDLLGVRGLSVLRRATELVRTWQDPAFEPDAIPPDDALTGELLAAGRTMGCFQIESSGMQEMLRQLQVSDLPGVIAAISLYRPGPLRGGMKEHFVRRFRGQEAVTYLHPALEPILRETKGVILYQEQVLRIAHEVAGLSLAEADTLRRAMTHFRSRREMEALGERFVRGAWQHSGVAPQVAEQIWGLLSSFAGYGFPKAHSASYAVVAYRSAFMKAHFPAEFMAARLAERGGYYPQRVYLNEARRLGLTLRPPHVNHSDAAFTLEYEKDGPPVLWMGLDSVRDLTQRTMARTIKERGKGTFVSLEDWLLRVRPRRAEAANLVWVGGMDGLGATRRQMLEQLEWIAPKAGAGQLLLPNFLDEADGAQEFDRAQLLKAEEHILGTVISEHPLARFEERLEEFAPVPSTELAHYLGQEVVVAGLRVSAWRHRTREGKNMMFLTLEDVDGLIEVIVFPGVYDKLRRRLARAGPFVIWGEVRPSMGEDDGVSVVVARDARLLVKGGRRHAREGN